MTSAGTNGVGGDLASFGEPGRHDRCDEWHAHWTRYRRAVGAALGRLRPAPPRFLRSRGRPLLVRRSDHRARPRRKTAPAADQTRSWNPRSALTDSLSARQEARPSAGETRSGV